MNIEKSLFCILDANLNRSREGLRVCEDVSRFILKSAAITRQVRSARHDISSIVRELSAKSNMLFDARDTASDIGRNLKLTGELKDKRSYRDIFAANIQRVKESLRVLEEFFKLVDKRKSDRLCALRFKAYDIEKKAIKNFESLRNTG